MSDSDGLRRGLGPVEAVALVVGGTIGASIFLVPSAVAREVGSPGLELVTWLVTGLTALCGALSFAELASAIPETGGTYQFLKRAYPGTPIAFLFGWMMFFTYAAGATAVTASLAAQYAAGFVPGLAAAGPWGIRIVAVLVILTFSAVNALGVREGGRTQTVLTILKVGGLLGVVLSCFALGNGSVANYLPILPADRSVGAMASGVGTAMMLTIFSYSGWYFITHVAGELREPARNLPRAILGSMAVVLCLYLAINAAYLYVLPFDTLKASDRVAADAVHAVFGPVGATIMSVLVFVSGIGGTNAQLLNYPRVAFSLAQDGLFFERLARIHPTRRTPATAILVFGVIASAFALAGTYQDILSYVAFVGQVFMVLTVVGLIVLRRREPGLVRPFRVPGYPVVPLVYVGILTWYLGNLLANRLSRSLVGIAIVAAGVPFYWYWSRKKAGASWTS